MSNALKLTLPEASPYIEYERELDFPVAEVFRAHTDPELYRQWIGPRGLTTRIDRFECRAGGSYRFVQWGEDGTEHAFRGTFHTVRGNEFILQTFEYEAWPDAVSLEYSTFEDLGGGRCRLIGRSVCSSIEARDAMAASGMEGGMAEGYERLEELLGAP